MHSGMHYSARFWTFVSLPPFPVLPPGGQAAGQQV